MKAKQRTKLLKVLTSDLAKLLGDELDQVILYGSQARGDARQDSDIDILLIINSEIDYAHLLRQTSEVIARLSLENEVVISRAFISKDRFMHEHSPFILNVKREGLVL